MRYYLQTKKTTLSYSISDSETTIRLSALTKLDGTSISASDIGDYMTGTFDPGTSKEEIFSIASSGVTVNADGTIDITGVVRGLREGGTAGYSTGGYSAEHGAGAVVVFSNNPQLYNQLANKSNDNTFTGLNIFSGYAPQTDTDPVAANDLTRLSYVQALVLGTLTTIDVVVPGTAGETIVDGNLIYLNTDNKWYKTDADTASTVNNVLLGIAKGAGTANNPITNGILLQGVDNAQSGLIAGEIQYASNTAGGISSTPGTTEVTVGVAKSTTELYFSTRFNQMLTEDQQDALGGTSGTPSASNKFVTDADTTATPTANKVARFDSNGNLPAYKLFTTLLCAETLAVGNLVASYYYQATTITYDTKVKGTGSTVGTATLAMTVGNNANRRIVVFISCGLGGNGNTWTPNCSYAGVAMTKLQQIGTTFNGSPTSVWTLEAPTVGANNITVDFSSAGGGSVGYTITAYSYYNVDQLAVDGSASASATTQNYTPSNTGALLVTSVMSAVAPTGGVNMQDNQQSQTRTGSELSHFDGDSGIVGSPALSTISATGGSVIFTVGLKPASSASYGYGVKTTATTPTNGVNSNKYNSVVGFVTAVTNGGIVGETATIQTDGVVTGLTSLIPFATYYVQDTAGTIGTTAGTNSKKIGVALTTTTLLIKHDN